MLYFYIAGCAKADIQCHAIWVSNRLYWGNVIQGSTKGKWEVSCHLFQKKYKLGLWYGWLHSGVIFWERSPAPCSSTFLWYKSEYSLGIGYKKIALRQQILFMGIPAVQEMIWGCCWLAPGSPRINLTQSFVESRSLCQSGNVNYSNIRICANKK